VEVATIEPLEIERTITLNTEPVEIMETVEETTVEIIEETTTAKVTPIEFRVTAYCSCYKCCGKWAYGRDRDLNGEEIVRGASGKRLETGLSCASPLPFGTEIELDEIGTVVVHDRTADWVVDQHGLHIIDVYMSNHSEASKFGVQYLEGVIKE
jgi:3D (Asp-Asp-Asp) domain-containing protein